MSPLSQFQSKQNQLETESIGKGEEENNKNKREKMMANYQISHWPFDWLIEAVGIEGLSDVIRGKCDCGK